MQSRPPAVWISTEAVGQAGAGALLVGIAFAELFLAFWAAGWLHRCCAGLVVAIGAALLAHALSPLARSLWHGRVSEAAQSALAARGRLPIAVSSYRWYPPDRAIPRSRDWPEPLSSRAWP